MDPLLDPLGEPHEVLDGLRGLTGKEAANDTAVIGVEEDIEPRLAAPRLRSVFGVARPARAVIAKNKTPIWSSLILIIALGSCSTTSAAF